MSKTEASWLDMRKAQHEINRWTKNRKRFQPLLANILLFAPVAFCVVIAVEVIIKNDSITAKSIIEILTLLVMAYTARQVIIMQENSAMEISHAVYEDTLKVLEKHEPVKDYAAIKRLKTKADHPKEEIIKDADYLAVNKWVYHYEYLGQLVRYNKVDFGLLFDTVTFPDELWKEINEGKNSILIQLRENRYDKWEGFEYLHVCYELLRKYDKYSKAGIKKPKGKKESKEEKKDRKQKSKEAKKASKKQYKKAISKWVEVKQRL